VFIKKVVSFREACWKPSSSHNSLTEGTLVIGTDGFLERFGEGMMSVIE
jgi:hypothetical protein